MELSQMLLQGCEQLGVSINETQMAQIFAYQNILLEWNEKMNLTAITAPDEIMIKHFLDSLSCLKAAQFNQKGTLIDVGTGAGFPGIPLKIVIPTLQVTLMDSLNKRIGFLGEVVKELGLQAVKLVHARAEELGQHKDYREGFDTATARAVAPLNVLAEYCLPFVKVGGFFLCQKGAQLEEELNQAKKAIGVLGGAVVEEIIVTLPFSQIQHKIVVIEKIRHTPTKYPRKSGKPGKEPIA